MSSKRGRKRNDNLPPNRARDVQRAFRARRAAHLQALEQRVSELEEENGCLRQALNLPPSARPPLGKGPTGKDKPRSFDAESSQSLGLPSSRTSSSVNSPASRTSSQSPDTMSITLSSRPVTALEPASWSDSMLLSDHHSGADAGPSEPPYQLAPVSTPNPLKPLQYPYHNSLSPPTRPISNTMYMGNHPQYPHTSDRPLSNNYGNSTYTIRNEAREEVRPPYPYPHHTFSSHDPNMHGDSPPPNITSHPHHNTNHQGQSSSNNARSSPLPYPHHRRSTTEPQGYLGQIFPHLPHPSQLQQSGRPLEYPRQSDNNYLPPNPRSATYINDGRVDAHA